ncbi:MAG: hypothetical protein LUD50_04650 [Clostridia bacterium]|nr:hypothetical protein [Clostridia bacterium]
METYQLRRRTPETDSEGGVYEAYEEAVAIQAIIWPAGGKSQAEQYGEKLTYMKNMEYSGTADIREGDGICVFVGPEADPDYRVVSIEREYNPKVITLEKR